LEITRRIEIPELRRKAEGLMGRVLALLARLIERIAPPRPAIVPGATGEPVAPISDRREPPPRG
jgi:hypothetical protein